MPVLFRSSVIRFFRSGVFLADVNCEMDVALGDYELLIEQPHTYTVQVVTYVEGWTLRRDDLVHSMKYRLGDKYMR
jgi:hypothetical protein